MGFGPVSITGMIGTHVVVRRPAWFGKVVDELYAGSAPDAFETSGKRQPGPSGSAAARIRCFVALAFLMVLDIAPVPVIGSIGLYVVIVRPGWFRRLVRSNYRGSGAERKQLSEAP